MCLEKHKSVSPVSQLQNDPAFVILPPLNAVVIVLAAVDETTYLPDKFGQVPNVRLLLALHAIILLLLYLKGFLSKESVEHFGHLRNMQSVTRVLHDITEFTQPTLTVRTSYLPPCVQLHTSTEDTAEAASTRLHGLPFHFADMPPDVSI